MIERQIVAANVNEFQIQEYIQNNLRNLGHSHIKLQRTPLGEKIVIYASRPGLIVGRKGQNIKQLTKDLKANFKLENPQIEINEVENVNLDAQIVAERIAGALERFGSQRFKGIGHRVLSDVMAAGAHGVEVLISGKIPSSRAKRWRFYQGYLKKCGDIALIGVRKAYAVAELKTGTVGIQVRIMPPDTKLPDNIELVEEPLEILEEIKEAPVKEKPKAKAKPKVKKTTKPKAKKEKEVKKETPVNKEKPVKKTEEKKTVEPEKVEENKEVKKEESVEVSKTVSDENKKEESVDKAVEEKPVVAEEKKE